MALQGGHRFAVSMADAFVDGVYAMSVVQATDYDEKTGRRPASKDKQTGEWVWTVTCMDREVNPNVPGSREVKVKVTGPVCPSLGEEIAPGTGLHAVVFEGLTVTPYLVEGAPGRRARLAYSFRATGLHAQGKAPTGSTTQTAGPSGTGRSGGPAPAGGQSGDGKAA
jgi:hypothetical protein